MDAKPYREAQWQHIPRFQLIGEIGVNERLQGFGTKIEQLLTLVLLLLFRQPVLGLRNFEFAVALDVNKADPEICTACIVRAAINWDGSEKDGVESRRTKSTHRDRQRGSRLVPYRWGTQRHTWGSWAKREREVVLA